MNKIVRDNYPVAELPEALREGVEPDATVRVTVEEAMTAPLPGETGFSLEALFKKARPVFANMREVSAHIDALRDEWDVKR